jgi:hypothetical protein
MQNNFFLNNENFRNQLLKLLNYKKKLTKKTH